MRIVTILLVLANVREGQQIKLGLAPIAGGIDGEQDGPGDAAADEADDGEHLQEAQVEKAIERLVIEHQVVGEILEGPEPIEPPFGQVLGPQRLGHAGEEGARAVDALHLVPQEQEDEEEGPGLDAHGDQGGEEAGDGGAGPGGGGGRHVGGGRAARLGGRAAEVSLWSTCGGEGEEEEEEEEDSIRGARLGRRGRTLAMAMEKRNGREREEEE